MVTGDVPGRRGAIRHGFRAILIWLPLYADLMKAAVLALEHEVIWKALEDFTKTRRETQPT